MVSCCCTAEASERASAHTQRDCTTTKRLPTNHSGPGELSVAGLLNQPAQGVRGRHGDITCVLCLRPNTRAAVAQPCTLHTVARIFSAGGDCL